MNKRVKDLLTAILIMGLASALVIIAEVLVGNEPPIFQLLVGIGAGLGLLIGTLGPAFTIVARTMRGEYDDANNR